MAEAIVISGFLVLLLGFQLKEQSKIIIPARGSIFKKAVAIILALTFLVIFWQPLLADQIKAIVFAALIVSFGFTKEGLGEKNLIKLGLLEGNFQRYKTIQIETMANGKCYVTFYENPTNHTSLFFDVAEKELVSYFRDLGLGGVLVVGDLPKVKKSKKQRRKAAPKAKLPLGLKGSSKI